MLTLAALFLAVPDRVAQLEAMLQSNRVAPVDAPAAGHQDSATARTASDDRGFPNDDDVVEIYAILYVAVAQAHTFQICSVSAIYSV